MDACGKFSLMPIAAGGMSCGEAATPLVTHLWDMG